MEEEKYPLIYYSNEISKILETPPKPIRKRIKVIVYIALIISPALLARFISNAIEVHTYDSIVGVIFFSTLCFICSIVFLGCFCFVIWNSVIVYKMRNSIWRRNVRKIETNEHLRLNRKQRIYSCINTRRNATEEEIDNFDKISKGICEKWFYDKIKNAVNLMGGEIFLDKKIMYNERSYYSFLEQRYGANTVVNETGFKFGRQRTIEPKYFYPDIAIYIGNLFVDVEIDEPYVWNSGQPIHCVGDDDYRNKFITSHGWEVIRFSEQQIVESTDKCIETIKNTIEYILDGRCNSPVPDENGKWRTKCWDKLTAENMASKCYRESYLWDNNRNLKIQV